MRRFLAIWVAACAVVAVALEPARVLADSEQAGGNANLPSSCIVCAFLARETRGLDAAAIQRVMASGKMCATFPTIVQPECTAFMNSHGAGLASLLNAGIAENDVCAKLSVCPVALVASNSENGSESENNTNSQSQGGVVSNFGGDVITNSNFAPIFAGSTGGSRQDNDNDNNNNNNNNNDNNNINNNAMTVEGDNNTINYVVNNYNFNENHNWNFNFNQNNNQFRSNPTGLGAGDVTAEQLAAAVLQAVDWHKVAVTLAEVRAVQREVVADGMRDAAGEEAR